MYNPETNPVPEINSVFNSGTNAASNPAFNPEKGMSRRDFLKRVGGISASALLAGYIPPLSLDPATPKVCGLSPSQDATTPEVCGFSLSQRIELMKDPKFFIELQGKNTREIATSQFDEGEYTRLERYAFSNNCCGESTLATIVKMCEFLNTCKVPDTTIADVIIKLDGVEFKDIRGYTAKYIAWNDSMCWVGIPGALMTLAPQLISKAEFLTPNYGARYTDIVPPSRWPETLSKAQAICEDGGFVIIGCMKYRGGHIVLGTDVKKDGTATIVDPYLGRARRVLLKDYFMGKQFGLIHMSGITPKRNVSVKPGLQK